LPSKNVIYNIAAQLLNQKLTKLLKLKEIFFLANFVRKINNLKKCNFIDDKMILLHYSQKSLPKIGLNGNFFMLK